MTNYFEELNEALLSSGLYSEEQIAINNLFVRTKRLITNFLKKCPQPQQTELLATYNQKLQQHDIEERYSWNALHFTHVLANAACDVVANSPNSLAVSITSLTKEQQRLKRLGYIIKYLRPIISTVLGVSVVYFTALPAFLSCSLFLVLLVVGAGFPGIWVIPVLALSLISIPWSIYGSFKIFDPLAVKAGTLLSKFDSYLISSCTKSMEVIMDSYPEVFEVTQNSLETINANVLTTSKSNNVESVLYNKESKTFDEPLTPPIHTPSLFQSDSNSEIETSGLNSKMDTNPKGTLF